MAAKKKSTTRKLIDRAKKLVAAAPGEATSKPKKKSTKSKQPKKAKKATKARKPRAHKGHKTPDSVLLEKHHNPNYPKYLKEKKALQQKYFG